MFKLLVFYLYYKHPKKIIQTQSKLVTHMQVNLTNFIHLWMEATVISFDFAYAYNMDRVQIIFSSFLSKFD